MPEYNDLYPPITEEAIENIPASMKNEKRWVCWGGNKVPVSISKARNGMHFGIDVTNPSNWGTLDEALASINDACHVGSLDEYFHVAGVGFVVGDEWFCIDLDGGANHQGKEDVPKRVIDDVIGYTGTYAEKSISRCGYHVFGKSEFAIPNDKPESNYPHRDENGNRLPESYEIEFFTRRKFIAITGNIVPGSGLDAILCDNGVSHVYKKYILADWERDEEKRKAERSKVRSSISVNANDAEKMFLLNYPEILAASDSSNFKRGGKGVTLGSGEYSWIGAVKAMQELGIPENDILDWCRRGSNFKSEKDVLRVLSRSSDKKCSVAGIVADAKAHGWKPDPEKLTGEYKKRHDEAQIEKGFNKGNQDIIAQDPEASWEHIIKSDVLSQFPLDNFPVWIADYIRNFVDNTGASPDFCAACILGAISAVVCGHLDIHFNATHYEPGQLYLVFVGRSGAMKSSVIKQFTAPARAWLVEQDRMVKSANQRITSEITKLKDEIDKEQKKKSVRNDAYISELSAKIDRLKEEQKNHFPIPLNDVTPESLIHSIIATRGTAVITAAEGNILNVLTGRSYSQRGSAPNLDVFLYGHDGEPLHSNRVTSGEVDIPRVDISMLIAVQPSLLESLCQSYDAVGRGLVQRFLLFSPQEQETIIDHTKPNTTDPEYQKRWNELVRCIASRFMHPDADPVVMELEPAADTIIRELWNYEGELIRQRGSFDEESITGWISKLHGKALRLAAIFAVLYNPQAKRIDEASASRSVSILKEYFIPHYIGAYERFNILSHEQQFIINWIRNAAQRTSNKDRFKESDAWNDLRQRKVFGEKNGRLHFRIALEGLCESNYIRLLENETSGTGGRPSKIWQINPEVFLKQ